MESKIYSRAEIEAMLPVLDTYARHFPNDRKELVATPLIIRQLLAKVDEAAKIEELMKTYCTIQNGVSGSPDILYCNNEVWTLQGFTDTTFDSLYSALTSLVGGGKS